jgi:hypothetical protein
MSRTIAVSFAGLAVGWSVLLWIVAFYQNVLTTPNDPSLIRQGWGILPFIAVPIVLTLLALVAVYMRWRMSSLVLGMVMAFLAVYSFVLIFSWGLAILVCVPLLAISFLTRPRSPSTQQFTPTDAA